ncbi:hypothetical protein [Lactobacillus sp. PV034]|uniref:hypothetical protein n=1 Tax=Lactobacillus sp. PV034 TaxID=2594495 RepID=UPI002240C62B|nr:hypothetical protein [Lactobacillus sp. PV034]QNQ80151.1 hypothetical protein FP432_00580 [Lactobacillus sp. PV034]
MKEEKRDELKQTIKLKQEQLEDEYYAKRNEFNEKLDLFNQTNNKLGQMYNEINFNARRALKEMHSDLEFFTSAEQINQQLQSISYEIYQTKRKRLLNEWEEYEQDYRKQKRNLEDELDRVRRMKDGH